MNVPKFIQLKAREQILEVVQASVLPTLWKFVLAAVWTVLPFFFLFPLWRQGSWGMMLFFAWLATGLIILGRLYLKWVRTIFVVTDMRVVDYDQRGFFYREVTEARFEQLDEVSVQVKGIVATLFRYGTLRLKLRGAAADIEIERVKHPEHLADVINDLRNEFSKSSHAVT